MSPPSSSSFPEPRGNVIFPASIATLWERMASFSAAETGAALRFLMEWLAREIDADNLIWIGAVRVLDSTAAQDDPFFGWRLRCRTPLHPEPEAYQRVLDAYYKPEHYGKLTPTYRLRPHDGKIDHVGMTGRASLAGAGCFRVHRLRDRNWIDYRAFRNTAHYKLYFEAPGITDRITVGFPVYERCESFFMIHRHRNASGPERQNFSKAEATLAGNVIRSLPDFHRRLFLNNGLLVRSKPLSPTEQAVLQYLLRGLSEKEIAESVGQQVSTTHKYVRSICAYYGVNTRASLMALWLNSCSTPL